jgi:hypothetical protein
MSSPARWLRLPLSEHAHSVHRAPPITLGIATSRIHGRFVQLMPNEQIVEVVEFETTDPALRGEMTITITLADADGGYRPACGRPTTRLAGGRRSRSCPRSSSRARTRARSLAVQGSWVNSPRSSGQSNSGSS